jgi:Tfp pilus assembly protein PilO
VSPGIPERLADATPWVTIDVLVVGLAFFLLSRVFGLVAPRLARTLTRRGLGLGLPLLLLVSVVGHVAEPEAALALSDGVGFTAFVLCFLLSGAWLAALLYRLVRRLLTRAAPARERSLTRGAEWRRVAAVTAPVAMVVALVQWDAARDEVKAIERRAQDLRTVIRALEATEKKSEEFARERERLEEKLDVLYAITPRSPELAPLVSQLEARAAEYGMSVLDWSSATGQTRDVLQEHRLTLVLEGSLERLSELVERTGRMSRLLSWQRIGVRAGRATATLSSYSVRETEAAPGRDSCVHPRSKVWLWPYTAKVRAARAEVDGLCAERARHDATRAQVDDFQSGRKRLEELVQAIEKVRQEWRVPPIVVERAPPAEAPPPPRKTT